MHFITVSSSWSRAGKSTCAVHIAHSLASSGLSTCLVDASLSQGSARYFGAISEPSFGSFTGNTTENGLRSEGKLVSSVRPFLDLLSLQRLTSDTFSGRTSSKESAELLREILYSLRSRFEAVVVDLDASIEPLIAPVLEMSEIVIVPLSESVNSAEGILPLLEHVVKTESPSRPPFAIVRNALVQHVSEPEGIILDRIRALLERRQPIGTPLTSGPKVCLLSTEIHFQPVLPLLADSHLTTLDVGDRSLSPEIFSESQSTQRILNLLRTPGSTAIGSTAREFESFVGEVLSSLAWYQQPPAERARLGR